MDANVKGFAGMVMGVAIAATTIGVSGWKIAHNKENSPNQERLKIAMLTAGTVGGGAFLTAQAGPQLMSWGTGRSGSPFVAGFLVGGAIATAVAGVVVGSSWGIAGAANAIG